MALKSPHVAKGCQLTGYRKDLEVTPVKNQIIDLLKMSAVGRKELLSNKQSSSVGGIYGNW